eukprot:scaffold118243_cov49-Tisochrysis_lutea.AAC.3
MKRGLQCQCKKPSHPVLPRPRVPSLYLYVASTKAAGSHSPDGQQASRVSIPECTTGSVAKCREVR